MMFLKINRHQSRLFSLGCRGALASRGPLWLKGAASIAVELSRRTSVCGGPANQWFVKCRARTPQLCSGGLL